MAETPCPHGHQDANLPCVQCNEPKRVGLLLCRLAGMYTMHPVHEPEYIKECVNCQAGDALEELREDMAFELGYRLQRKNGGRGRFGDFLTWAIEDRSPLCDMLEPPLPTPAAQRTRRKRG